MKCALCGRPLVFITRSIATRAGPMAYGPVCAKKAGLLDKRERRRRVVDRKRPVPADPAQLTLELAL